MNNIVGQIVTVATAIIGLAILTVLVRGNSKTVDVITAIGGVFTDSIKVASSPTGNY
jgi:hypothetical protein